MYPSPPKVSLSSLVFGLFFVARTEHLQLSKVKIWKSSFSLCYPNFIKFVIIENFFFYISYGLVLLSPSLFPCFHHVLTVNYISLLAGLSLYHCRSQCVSWPLMIFNLHSHPCIVLFHIL